MTIRPVEWIMFAERAMHPIAIIREVKLGMPADRYMRAVTASADPARRTLIGYWETLEEAIAGVEAFFDPTRSSPRWKPPPAPRIPGQAASPKVHGKHEQLHRIRDGS